MESSHTNRMDQGGENREQGKRKRGRPRKTYEPAEVLETRATLIRCSRCGRDQAARVSRIASDGRRLHRCTGCGEWLRV